jgi:hypothetical protein
MEALQGNNLVKRIIHRGCRFMRYLVSVFLVWSMVVAGLVSTFLDLRIGILILIAMLNRRRNNPNFGDSRVTHDREVVGSFVEDVMGLS